MMQTIFEYVSLVSLCYEQTKKVKQLLVPNYVSYHLCTF